MQILAPLEDLVARAPEVHVSAAITGEGGTFADEEINSSDDLSIASIGKVLLLIETARQLESGELSPTEHLSREDVDPVHDSGLWQHLAVSHLPLVDTAVLTAAVSDNLATNVLLNRVGLERIDATRRDLGLTQTRLLDRIRDSRTAGDPETFATGSAGELCALMRGLGNESILSRSVSRRVAQWLTANVDLSMVASAWELDPLAHSTSDTVRIFNKTGNDVTVRADCGFASCEGTCISYAVIVNWDAAEQVSVGEVHGAMRGMGRALMDTAWGAPTTVQPR